MKMRKQNRGGRFIISWITEDPMSASDAEDISKGSVTSYKTQFNPEAKYKLGCDACSVRLGICTGQVMVPNRCDRRVHGQGYSGRSLNEHITMTALFCCLFLA